MTDAQDVEAPSNDTAAPEPSPKASLIMDDPAVYTPTEAPVEVGIDIRLTDDVSSKHSGSSRSSTRMSTYSSGVDWDELGRSEEQEARQDNSDEVDSPGSTARRCASIDVLVVHGAVAGEA